MNFKDIKKQSIGKTLLGVGPVTKTVTKAAIQLANEHNVPLLLIPSRRQIETKLLGGGYVFTTEDFSQFVRNNDTNNKVLMARDHGSIYQGSKKEDSIEKEYENAMLSYRQDIVSNFDILHIDPAINGNGFEDVCNKIRYFYSECEKIAKEFDKELIYEIGTDGHGTEVSDEVEVRKLCALAKEEFPKAKFIVSNVGSYVKEDYNVGKISYNAIDQFSKLAEESGLMLKAHNMDYLSYRTLKLMPSIGCHSANVAPYYGTEETKYLLSSLYHAEMYEEREEFIELACNSKKYEKWLLKETSDSNKERMAALCGHYIMEYERVLEIKHKLNLVMDYDVNSLSYMKNVIMMHLKSFGWVK